MKHLFLLTISSLILITTACAVDPVTLSEESNASVEPTDSAETAVSVNSYLLGAGDEISITVYGQPDLSIEVVLDQTGVLNYPFLGEINLTDKSIRDIEKILTTGLKGDYLVDPIVQVQIVQYRPFYIFGDVNKPGSYTYQPGMTVLQGIALAGGVSDGFSKVKTLLHQKTLQPLEQEKTDEEITADDAQNKESIEVPLDHLLSPGDTVEVERRYF